ncbi:MAG: hypothetical protein ACRYG5_06235 [Janthinobacterium lividum]
MRDPVQTPTQTWQRQLENAVACVLKAIQTGETTRLDLGVACLYAQPEGAWLTLVLACTRPASIAPAEAPNREQLLAHLADAHPSNGIDIPVVAALSDDGAQLLHVVRIPPPTSSGSSVAPISLGIAAQTPSPGFDATLHDALCALLDLVRRSAR